MQVKFLRDYEVKVSAIDSRVFPQGWQGEIDDKLGAAAVKAKAAERVVIEAPKDGDQK
jgi:hypothetical protein